jgi:hypothetical protein
MVWGMDSFRVRAATAAVLLLVVSPAVRAANPFEGRWVIESFGQTDVLIFEFIDETRMLIVASGETSPEQAYGLDTVREVLTLPRREGGDMVLRYAWLDPDTFMLYMSDALLDQMAAAFTQSLPSGKNSLTEEVVGKLRDAVRGVFEQSPFMRGTRTQ